MRKQVLGEVLMKKLKIIREYVQDIPQIKEKLESMDNRLAVVETDVKVIKDVVRDHSQTLQRHDGEIKELQQKVA